MAGRGRARGEEAGPDGHAAPARRPPLPLLRGRAAGPELPVRVPGADRRPTASRCPTRSSSTEVDKNNVKEVFAKGDSLQGTFKNKVQPAGLQGHKPETKFTTFRPAFAPSNDDLLNELREKNVVVSAKALDSGRSIWADILLFFGPTLLLVGIFVFAARRAGGGAAGLGGLGRSRAKRYDAGSVDAHDVRRRRGHRRGRGRARGGRRLPQEPRQVPLARRDDPQGRAALAASRARARRCWRARSPARPTCRSSRSARREFIEMVVGVGASPRARPLHAGQGGGAVDHLHRRARRDRPPARRRRVARRPRRARADAQPDPHRDGRLRRLRGRHRPGLDQPPRRP